MIAGHIAVQLVLRVGVIATLELAAGIFSLLLFALSMYSWSRRRHYSLLLFSAAFLAFFLKTLVDEVLPLASYVAEFIGAGLNFIILALFFLALVIGSGRKKLRVPEKPADH
ncbi:MAG: hypothetical protein JRN52_04330 [Nitrososphaerota archaeon]|nr:hypothetical protein [Nitrososphaerota archaeon]